MKKRKQTLERKKRIAQLLDPDEQQTKQSSDSKAKYSTPQIESDSDALYSADGEDDAVSEIVMELDQIHLDSGTLRKRNTEA